MPVVKDDDNEPKSQAQIKMELAAKQPKKRYLLLAGSHLENEYDPETGENISKSYDSVPGQNIVESHRDLITMFGANKFKLIDDNKVVLETSEDDKEGGVRKSRVSREDRIQANKDSINKVTEEEAAAYDPNDPAKKIPYAENAGFEQPPPDEELENPVDKRIAEKPVVAKKKRK